MVIRGIDNFSDIPSELDNIIWKTLMMNFWSRRRSILIHYGVSCRYKTSFGKWALFTNKFLCSHRYTVELKHRIPVRQSCTLNWEEDQYVYMCVSWEKKTNSMTNTRDKRMRRARFTFSMILFSFCYALSRTNTFGTRVFCNWTEL